MARMTGGEAIIDSLIRHGIDTMFGLPGVQTYGLFDALARNANRTRLINARHEQTTAYMALGYSCATGRPSAYSVVPGPGVLNTTAALATAWGVNAPVLCVTGQDAVRCRFSPAPHPPSRPRNRPCHPAAHATPPRVPCR